MPNIGRLGLAVQRGRKVFRHPGSSEHWPQHPQGTQRHWRARQLSSLMMMRQHNNDIPTDFTTFVVIQYIIFVAVLYVSLYRNHSKL